MVPKTSQSPRSVALMASLSSMSPLATPGSPATRMTITGDRLSAICFMTAANAVHMAAYEFGRSATMTLFTSDVTGFSRPSAITIATGLVSPFSIGLLWLHRRVFESLGPRKSVAVTTSVYSSLLLISTLVLQASPPRTLGQATVLLLFVFKNGFVHLLMAQHWSFLISLLQSKVASWTPILAGMASIASTLAGWAVSPVVELLSTSSLSTGTNPGLIGLLLLASVGVFSTLFLSDAAYAIAAKNEFLPSAHHDSHGAESVEREPLVKRARALFHRVPVLGALCSEVLICQSISSLLSFLFVICTKEALPDDAVRARHTGNVYARINLGTGILQFAVLPFVLEKLTHVQHWMWLTMPLAVLFPAVWMTFQSAGSFEIVTATFCIMKTLEYSLRGALTETVYGSLDYESRFFGKEIISLFANRFGKSTTAVALAVLSSLVPSFGSIAPIILLLGDVTWLGVSYKLGTLLREKSKVDWKKE